MSSPTTFARYSRLFASFTVTCVALRTTCAFVRITPSGRTMKPDPRLCTGTFCGTGSSRKNRKNGSSPKGELSPNGLWPWPWSCPWSWSEGRSTLWVVMLTTAARF